MRNKSKNRIKQEMRVRIFMLERENKLLRNERDIARHYEIYYRSKWEHNAPKFMFEPTSVLPIRARYEAPLEVFQTASSNADFAHWVKQRFFEQVAREVEAQNLLSIERIGNAFEVTAFLAIPKQIPEPTVRAHMLGDFEAALDAPALNIKKMFLKEV